MLLLKFLRRNSDDRLDQTAHDLSRRLYSSLRGLADRRCGAMRRAEVRGYLRVTSRPMVREAVAAWAEARRGWGLAKSERLAEMVSERLVRAVLVDVVCDATPVFGAPQRRAA